MFGKCYFAECRLTKWDNSPIVFAVRSLRVSDYLEIFLMTITEQLRTAIRDSNETHYRIREGSGVDTRSLDRFMSGETPHIGGRTIDLLCEYFDLELRRKKQRRSAKQAGKKRPTTGKQAAKK
jgi:hypothetical protein